MENFDFSTEDKKRVLFIINVKPKKFIFSTIVFNFLLTIYTLVYLICFFRLEKNFERDQLIVLECLNVGVTLLIFWVYTYAADQEAQRILFFYFYFTIIYIAIFVILSVMFFFSCYEEYTARISNKKEVHVVVIALLPLLLIFFVKLSQQISYYFASKMIE